MGGLSGERRAELEQRLASVQAEIVEISKHRLSFTASMFDPLREKSEELEAEADLIRNELDVSAAPGRPPRGRTRMGARRRQRRRHHRGHLASRAVTDAWPAGGRTPGSRILTLVTGICTRRATLSAWTTGRSSTFWRSDRQLC